MLTNFHLPQSTLLMLVSAFAGREKVLQAYEHAVTERYRFYSYGDCMFSSKCFTSCEPLSPCFTFSRPGNRVILLPSVP